MPGAIARVESPSHPISVATDGLAARRSPRRNSDAALDRDFVLSVGGRGPRRSPRVDRARTTMAGSRSPSRSRRRFSERRRRPRSSSSIDRSGSMEGNSIDEVRNALQLCLRSMMRRLPLQHRRLRIDLRIAVPREPSVRRGEPGGGERTRRIAERRPGRHRNSAGAGVRARAASRRELPRQVVILTDGQVTQHGRRARARPIARGARQSLHLRHRSRCEPSPGARHRARRRRRGGVHLRRESASSQRWSGCSAGC